MKKVILAVAGIAVIGVVYYFTAGKIGKEGAEGMSLPSISKSELSTLVQSKTASYKRQGFDVVEKDGEQVLKFSQPDESNALVTEEVVDA